MHLLLNEEQNLLRESALTFFAEQSPVEKLRQLRDSNDALGYDPALWRQMAELGWAGILVSENHGGLEFGYLGMGQVLEASGRTLAASPLLATALIAAPLLERGASEALKAIVLPALANGSTTFAFALEEGARHAPYHIETRAAAEGDEFVLNGHKTFVLDGHSADQLIVAARTDGSAKDKQGIALFVVPRDAVGVHVTRTFTVDSRNTAMVDMTDVRVAASASLGEPGQAITLLEGALDGARAGLAAEMLGSGTQAFERTINYLKMREQFDVPIGSFQALKHRAALMFCELELTRSAVMAALIALDEQRDDVAELCSLAKCKASEMLNLVSSEAVQMHGGIGMTDAEEIGFFLKRARVAEQSFGDESFHRQRYAELVGV